MKTYPQYYEVNDTFVKVDIDTKTDEVYAKTKSGKDYPLGKILTDGHRISEQEFKSS